MRFVMRTARVLAVALAVALLVVSLSTAIIAALTPTPTFDEVRMSTLGSESTLLSRDGEPLQRLRVDMTRRQLEWTALECDFTIAGPCCRCRGGSPLLVAFRVRSSKRRIGSDGSIR